MIGDLRQSEAEKGMEEVQVGGPDSKGVFMAVFA